MLEAIYSKVFLKDAEKAKKRGKQIDKLMHVHDLLLKDIILPAQYRNHKLKGNYVHHFECHIQPDWLLIYRKTKTQVFFARTGTHSDLF